MSQKRRKDLIIPYQRPLEKESAQDIGGTIGSTLPMAAMFTRNKFVGWASVIFAVQSWLGESSETKKKSSQPAIFSILMSVMSLFVTYLPMFIPTTPKAPINYSGAASTDTASTS
ncbi:hypothetical protein BGHDH14_bgh05041 [Blumeria hordei DH14]|uniref:Uncharacterized protein n=1 Tax=Blumeria graminis f. sp. hordei (strain DH14) TaxID=546991 RepID=N1JJ93_BLUG1|nr:hypothetical protein BGHDH14_bgh05041 [Blumeria hordei DH14]